MPRIIVTTDAPVPHDEPAVVLDEQVHSVHLSTGHAAAQLVERLAWAISDAEDSERQRGERRPDARGHGAPRHRAPGRGGARRALAA